MGWPEYIYTWTQVVDFSHEEVDQVASRIRTAVLRHVDPELEAQDRERRLRFHRLLDAKDDVELQIFRDISSSGVPLQRDVAL